MSDRLASESTTILTTDASSEAAAATPAGQDLASLRANHAALSPLWAQWLDFAARRPDCSEAASFGDLGQVEANAGYAVQPWPTFVDQRHLTELARLNNGLCKLIGSLPSRVFGEDFAALLEFYGHGPEMLPLVRFAHKRPQHLDYLVGRSDLLQTRDGFRCLEFNVSARIGGFQNGYLARNLRVPVLDHFLAESGAEVRWFDVVRRLQAHCIGCVLRHFRLPEVNIAVQVNGIDELALRTQAEFEEAFHAVLAGLGGVRGSVQMATPDDLEARGGMLYLGDTRIHLVLETNSGPSTPATYRCWMNDAVLLLDGPLTPILADKRNLALLSELADSDLFDEAERQLIRQVVPWTRRLSSISVAGRPAPGLGAADLIERQAELVIKRATGSGGTEVVLGAGVGGADWSRHVQTALAQGDWIVQERLESLLYLYQLGDRGSFPHEVIWGPMTFGDRYGGDTMRVAPIGKPGVVNASRGARIGVLWEVLDPAEKASRI